MTTQTKNMGIRLQYFSSYMHNGGINIQIFVLNTGCHNS